VIAGALCVSSAFAAERSGNAGSLFVLKANGGRLHTLTGPRRPNKLVLRDPVGDVKKTRNFIRAWKRNGFDRHPPTAAVVVANAPEDRDVQIVELRHPRLLEGGDVAFQARAAKAGGGLRHFQGLADPHVPHRFGQVSLFVDPTHLVTLNLMFYDLPPIAVGSKFTATLTNAQFAAPGSQGFTVIATDGVQVELRRDQILLESAGFKAASGVVGFTVTTQDPFISGLVTSVPAGMSGTFTAGPDARVPLKLGPFKFSY